MKLFKIAAVATALLGMTTAAQAQDSGAYGAIGVDTLEFDAYTLSARLGYNFSDYFGVEGQAGFGIIDDKETFGGVEVKTGVDSLFAGFLTGRVPVAEQFELIGRVGYYTADLSASGGGVSASENGDGVAFGAGGQFWMTDRDGIRLEYTYLDGDGGHADSVSLMYTRKF